MSNSIEDLRELVEKMQKAYDATYERLEKQISATYLQQGLTPEDMMDAQGRPILLDAMLRILEARILLARYDDAERKK